MLLGGNLCMKKILSIILCMGLCIMYTLPVSATEAVPKENDIEKEEISATSGSNYFSGVLPKLSSTSSTASRVVTLPTGSTSGSAHVTSIRLYVRAGGYPFILYLQAPDGTIYSFVITKSETITLDNINGCNPSDSWKIWIETQGTVSTATITATIYYDYNFSSREDVLAICY